MFHSEYEKKLRSPSKSPSSKLYYQNNNYSSTSSPIPLPLSTFFQTNLDSNKNSNNSSISNNNNNINNSINNNENDSSLIFSSSYESDNGSTSNSPIKRSPNKNSNTTTTTTTTTTISANDSYGDRFIPMSIGIESQNNYSLEESYFYPSENGLYSIDRQKDESMLAYNMVLKNELLGSSLSSSSFLDTSFTSPIKNQFNNNNNSNINPNLNNNNTTSNINNSNNINTNTNNSNNTVNNNIINNNIINNNINTNTNINNSNNNNNNNQINYNNGNNNLEEIFNNQSSLNNNNNNNNNNSNNSNSNNNNNNNNKNYKNINNLNNLNNNININSILKYNKMRTSINSLNQDSPFSLSPLSDNSQKLLSSPRKPQRKIPKTPIKILDAPMIKDDFYLNLIDWSSQNVLAVGLDTSIYLYNATTSQVSKLCEMEANQPISSVSWIQRGSHLAVGGNDGIVQIWDVNKKKKIRELQGHSSRVNSLAWNNYILSSGGKDKVILNHDVRSNENTFTSRLVGHRHEICGLKWSPDGQQLASGGNDNLLNVWDNHMMMNSTTTTTSISTFKPLYQFKFHYAAVKAIAWSPHQRGLLASGGGTHDKCIRFWNTMNGQSIQSIDTGSQVCNLAWSKNVNELVSTHGYSQNQISVWSYPSMTPVTTLTGHTMRVLYLAVSPDGQTVCTGAGDHSLRFWNIFPSNKESSFSTKLDSFYNKKELDIR